ncbi:hypothetical protein B14911_18270 [Bacillus sp. NRRL B-14911]|nr:hypothetical protein B14911_18270 [Bacillus sp. NRRL B-14911]
MKMERMMVKDLPVIEDKVRKWSAIVYWTGVGIIILLAAISLYHAAQLPDGAGQPDAGSQAAAQETVTSLIIKPIAESPKFQVIFEYLFYLLLWLLLWLLVPSASRRIIRFKLGNLEFDLDQSQKEVISIIDDQMRKFKFLTYLMKEENKNVLKTSFDSEHPRFHDALDFALAKMQEFYLSEWDEHLTFEVMTLAEFHQASFPSAVKRSLELVDLYKTGIPINKENPEVIHDKNYLVYTTSEEENIYTSGTEVVDYVICVSSYRSEFNENDGYLVAGITSLVSELHKRAWENLGLTKLRERLNL